MIDYLGAKAVAQSLHAGSLLAGAHASLGTQHETASALFGHPDRHRHPKAPQSSSDHIRPVGPAAIMQSLLRCSRIILSESLSNEPLFAQMLTQRFV